MKPLDPAIVAFIAVFAGLFGLLIGSFLNVVIHRVPAGISLMRESRCPHCGVDVRPWENMPVVSWIFLRGACSHCKSPISVRYPLVELTTGIAFAAITWWFLTAAPSATTPAALSVVIAAYLYFAAISIALTLIDLDTHRLPNSIVLPSYLVGGVLLVLACILGAEWSSLLRAAIGMAVLYTFYFVLRLVRPGGMGGGDVKLAGVVGLYLAWLGWGALAVGAFGAFVLGGIVGVALLVARRAGRKTAIPFGPWMIVGAWVGIFTGEAMAQWYVGLFINI